MNLKELLKVVKNESIPKNAAVNIMHGAAGRSVRFEWTKNLVA